MLHDLTIRTIVSYLRSWNVIMRNLQMINRRYYSLRDIFIGRMHLWGEAFSKYYGSSHYGWNKIYSAYIDSLPELNLSNLILLHKIEIHDCINITDLAAFGTSKTISQVILQNCRNVVDVSPFANVKKIRLKWCHNISDVSPLKKVPNICLYACFNIHDVSSLGRVHHLELTALDVTNVDELGTVHDLTLHSCMLITDVSQLGTVKNLKIYYCYNLRNITALRTVSTLDLCGLRAINLANLHNVTIKEIVLANIDYVIDVRPLAKIQNITLIECSHVINAQLLSNVDSLMIIACSNIMDHNLYPNVRKLKIRRDIYEPDDE